MINFQQQLEGHAVPAFIITIDTEADNVWSAPQETTTYNARYLSRFQALCESYGFKPVYLTTWEMAQCPGFQELGREVIRSGRGEIGMHLHAWNSPPFAALTEDDFRHQPYLIEYPEPQIREKVRVLTETLEDIFDEKMVSHRAGRWAFNEVYLRILIENGFLVDCSVTPHLSWRGSKGAPAGAGGSDFRGFPEHSYYLDPSDIALPGDSDLLEVPMTIIKRNRQSWSRVGYLLGRVAKSRALRFRYGNPVWWLRPNGVNRAEMLSIVRLALEQGRDYVQFMLHSSELMPGASPNFQSACSIDRLYDDMEALFCAARTSFRGLTLREYRQNVKPQNSESRRS